MRRLLYWKWLLCDIKMYSDGLPSDFHLYWFYLMRLFIVTHYIESRKKAFPLRGRGTAIAVDEGLCFHTGKMIMQNKSIFPGAKKVFHILLYSFFVIKKCSPWTLYYFNYNSFPQIRYTPHPSAFGWHLPLKGKALLYPYLTASANKYLDFQ